MHSANNSPRPVMFGNGIHTPPGVVQDRGEVVHLGGPYARSCPD